MKKGYLYIALSTLFFSTMEIALRICSTGFKPLQMNFIRFFIGSVILLPFAVKSLRSRRIRLRMNDFLYFLLTGFVCVVVSMTFYQLAVTQSQASVVAILFSCNPVFVIPFASLFLGEKITRATIASMFLSLLGILAILNPLHIGSGVSGILLTLLAAVTFAFYGVIGKKRSGYYGGLASTALSFLAGSFELLILILISRIGVVSDALRQAGLSQFADVPLLQGITPAALPGILYIGVFVTGLGYAFYLLSMEKTSAAAASTVFFIKPALAPVLALMILGEPITPRILLGIAFIIAGSLALLVPGLRARARKNPESTVSEE